MKSTPKNARTLICVIRGQSAGALSRCGRGPSALLLLVLTFGLAALPARGAEAAPTCKTTVVATNAWVASTSSGRLFTVAASNLSAGTLYLFVVNTNSTPGTGAVPLLPAVQIPAAGTGWWDFQNMGFTFDKGLAICASTTQETLTVAAAGSFTIATSYQGR